MFKKDLNNFLGDIKEVVDKFQLLLSRTANEVLTKWDQEHRTTLQKHDIPLFSLIRRYVTNYVFDLIYQQFDRLKNPNVIKNTDALKPYTRHFRNAFELLYVHEIQRRFTRGDGSLTIDNIYPH